MLARAILLAVACAVLAPAAASATIAPATPGSRYLALGDSVSFGYQEPTVVPAPNYRRARSFVGFPQVVGAALHLRVTNAACPGETSASLIDPSAPSLGCESAYRRDFPLHVRYRGSQLGFAVRFLRAHRRVRLVSLMIGANDLFRCQAAAPCDVPALLRRVGGNVRRIVATLRGRAHYRGQLAIVRYFSLNYASSATNAVVRALNRAVVGAARPYRVVVADGFAQFRAGAAKSAGSSCRAGLLTQLSTGACGVHPSYAGQALLAQAVARAIAL